MKKLILLLFLCVLAGVTVDAQNFKGGAFLGSNFSHVRGDNMVGYNKPGFNLGFRVAYPMSEKMNLSMAISYSQKGSRRTYTPEGFPRGGGSSWHLLRTNYVEVPFSARFKVMNRIKGDVGLGIARLIGTYKSDYLGGGEVPVDFMRDFEYSFQLGGSYELNEKYSFFIRHSTSLFSVQTGDFSTFLHPWSRGLIHMVSMLGIERTFK